MIHTIIDLMSSITIRININNMHKIRTQIYIYFKYMYEMVTTVVYSIQSL